MSCHLLCKCMVFSYSQTQLAHEVFCWVLAIDDITAGSFVGVDYEGFSNSSCNPASIL